MTKFYNKMALISSLLWILYNIYREYDTDLSEKYGYTLDIVSSAQSVLYSMIIAPNQQLHSSQQILETLNPSLDSVINASLFLSPIIRALVAVIHDTKQFDFIFGLGVHPHLGETNLNKLLGITSEEHKTTYQHIGLLNHAWNTPFTLISIDQMEQDEIKQIAGAQHALARLRYHGIWNQKTKCKSDFGKQDLY